MPWPRRSAIRLQRFFNLLYTRNDPQLIPFTYRIPEERLTKTDFAQAFYRRLLSQYFAFTTRTPELVAMSLPLAELKELAASDRPILILDPEKLASYEAPRSWSAT